MSSKTSKATPMKESPVKAPTEKSPAKENSTPTARAAETNTSLTARASKTGHRACYKGSAESFKGREYDV